MWESRSGLARPLCGFARELNATARDLVAKTRPTAGARREQAGQIVAILSVGCSQNMAAQYVGCSPATIQRTAERDPKFAKQLREAKGNAELGLVKNIRNAAKKEQYWRAAAWALERGFPEKYARRGPDVITVEQIGLLLAQFSDDHRARGARATIARTFVKKHGRRGPQSGHRS